MTRLSRLSRSIDGRVAHITGAASGMGRATAHLFADEGAVVAVTDRERADAERVAEEIRAAGGRAVAWSLDVADRERIRTVAAEIEAELGPVDILVNNAGIAIGVSIAEEDDAVYEAEWSRAMDVMLNSHVRLIRATLPQLTRAGEGRIINIASTEALGATAGTGPYTAAKHGVVGVTRSLAVELGKSGVTVNCVCPGPVLTGLTEMIPEEHREKFARRHVPLRRYGVPEEVAHATLSLALPAASFINGVVLPVDGGMTIRNA